MKILIRKLVKLGLILSTAGAGAGSIALLLLILGVGAGYLGRPAVEQYWAPEIKQYTGVDLRKDTPEEKPKFAVDVPAEKAASVDTILVGVGPNGAVLIHFPAGLEELIASGSTHLIRIEIKEHSAASYVKMMVMMPGTGVVQIGIGGVKDYSCTITQVIYPEPPVEGVDDF